MSVLVGGSLSILAGGKGRVERERGGEIFLFAGVLACGC